MYNSAVQNTEAASASQPPSGQGGQIYPHEFLEAGVCFCYRFLNPFGGTMALTTTGYLIVPNFVGDQSQDQSIPFQEQQSVPGQSVPPTLLPCVQHSAQLVSSS